MDRIHRYLCVMLMLCIALCSIPAYSEDIGKPQDGFTEIVVAATDIKCGTKLTKRHLTTVRVWSENLPGNILTDPSMLIGYYSAHDIAAGEYISKSSYTSERTSNVKPIKEITRRKSPYLYVTEYLIPNTG